MMDKPVIATTIDGLTITGRLTTGHAASSYGQPVLVADDGQVYDNHDIISIAEIDDEAEDAPLSIAEQVYQAARPLLPSESWPHIGALSEAGLLDALTISQAATIVHLMQAAYRNGQGSRGAEKIDNDYVWLDGVGGLERQSDGTWTVTAPDQALASSVAADLGRRGGQATSEAKRAASRVNGRKGGRPRGDGGSY